MSDPQALDPDTRAAVAAHVARVKHDLGKYVAFQARWLGPDAGLEDRREALVADLLATRRGPDGTLDAPSLWAGFRPVLVGEETLPGGATVDLSTDSDLQRIDAAMAVIAGVAPSLREGTADASAVAEASRAALQVAEACRALARRYRPPRT